MHCSPFAALKAIVQDVAALPAAGWDIAVDACKTLCTCDGSEAPGDFLFQLDHEAGRLIVVKEILGSTGKARTHRSLSSKSRRLLALSCLVRP